MKKLAALLLLFCPLAADPSVGAATPDEDVDVQLDTEDEGYEIPSEIDADGGEEDYAVDLGPEGPETAQSKDTSTEFFLPVDVISVIEGSDPSLPGQVLPVVPPSSAPLEQRKPLVPPPQPAPEKEALLTEPEEESAEAAAEAAYEVTPEVTVNWETPDGLTSCSEGSCAPQCTGPQCASSSSLCSGPQCAASSPGCSGPSCSAASPCEGPYCSPTPPQCTGPYCAPTISQCTGSRCEASPRAAAKAANGPQASKTRQGSSSRPYLVPLNRCESPSKKVSVRCFNVVGATQFSAEALNQVANRFAKQTLTVDELEDVAYQVKSVYVRAGFCGVTVFIPVQALNMGVITIVVVENS